MSPPAYDEGNPLASEEPAVKITAAETKIDIGKEEQEKGQYQSLSKEELMKFANDPYWVRLRWILFALFWVIWVAMLVASIVIIIHAPKCPSPEPKQWWQKNAMYKVDVAEFNDLAGIQAELDYLVGSGVGTVYITSFTMPTPSNNDGVLDYKTINPAYGTEADWKKLVEAFQKRDQKVVIDFIPDHSADTDINLEDPKVIQDLEDVMKFWIETGVNGFVMDDVKAMVDGDSNLTELLRTVVDAETEKTGVPCVLMADSLSEQTVPDKYYGPEISDSNIGSLFHLSLYSNQVTNPATATDLKNSIDQYTKSLPTNAWPSYAFSSTTNAEMIDAMTMVKMLLPGTPMFVAGEELGLDTWDLAEAEKQGQAPGSSHLEVFSTLAAKLRHQDSVLFGEMEGATFVQDENVFGLTRVKKGNPGYLLLANFGDETMELDISDIKYIPANIRLMVKSVSGEAPAEDADVDTKSFETNKVLIEPKEGRVFTFVPKFA
jgi:glycosidase